jgi:hypothetical protein
MSDVMADEVIDELDLAEIDAQEMNERKIEMSLAWFSEHPEEIESRLDELDREWDLNRLVQVGAAGMTLGGVGLGFLFGRKWFLLPGIAGWMLWKYGVRNECPPAAFLRRLGIRTVAEIEAERQALLSLAGDEPDDGGEAGGDEEGAGSRKKKNTRKGEQSEASSKSGAKG